MKLFLKALCLTAVCSLFIILAACNTTKGFGTDIERAGAGMKGSAERNGAQ